MNKQQFGDFIADNRRAAGLTQKALAERLHVTDKAVSKWERALSYPDVTLLEPLAEALEMGVEELMSCRRTEVKKEEEPVKTLLEISQENLKAEKRKSRYRIAIAALVILAVALAAGWYQSTYVREERKDSIIMKETVGESHYIYVEEKGHLLRLKCGEGVDFEHLALTDEGGYDCAFLMDCRWNRRTFEGTVSTCSFYGVSLGGLEDASFEVENAPLFWYDEVHYTSENYYPDPYGEPRGQVHLCDFRFWTGEWNYETFQWEDEKTVLVVKDCLNAVVADIDQDGHNEVVVRTRWPEKPYAVYDWISNDWSDKEYSVLWPESVSPELKEQLRCIWEQDPVS